MLITDTDFVDPVYHPVEMTPINTVAVLYAHEDTISYSNGDGHVTCAVNDDDAPVLITIDDTTTEAADYTSDADEHGKYVELCFTADLAQTVLADDQQLGVGEIATMRVYVAAAVKRTVVVKEDDILTRAELLKHATDVAAATLSELKTWLANACFKIRPLKGPQNTMTSRYVPKWKWIKVNGEWKRIIRMRLCLRGFMDTEAFSLDTFSGTARRTSQRMQLVIQIGF